MKKMKSGDNREVSAVKKSMALALCVVCALMTASCLPGILDSPNGSISDSIPTNASVNVAWGGDMCEADGNIYCISYNNSEYRIVRLDSDGNAVPISEEHDIIRYLVSDGANIYFIASTWSNETESLFSVPASGGEEKIITDGHFLFLQYVNDRLFWEDFYIPSGEIAQDQTMNITIHSINPDGTEMKTLFAQEVPATSGHAVYFLATVDGLYYAISGSDKSDIFRMDLTGDNQTKINKSPLDTVDELFYDQGVLYFLMQHFTGSGPDPFWDSMETLDKNGNVKTIIKRVGYFPQDFGCVQYCGVSNYITYYFDLPSSNGSSEHLYMNLHQYDINKGKDTIILRNVDMGDNFVASIRSIRGKNIENNGTSGMYILGNDIYFSPFALP